jgi:Ulp1 family protease
MLITINKRAKKITLRCLDGFNSTSAHSDLFLEVERIFKEIFKKQKPPYKFEHKSLEIRSQNNGDDCGVVVCNYAELFLKYKGNVVKFEKHLKEKGSEARDYTKYRTSRNLHIRSKIRLD